MAGPPETGTCRSSLRKREPSTKWGKGQGTRRMGSITGPSATPTALLLRWRKGDREAFDRLVPLVHDELRRLAHHYMGHERRDHTLQATALVNEAYLRLIEATQVEWQ